MSNQNPAEANEEMIEALNHMGEKIGMASRKLANKIGIWHLCSQVFVFVRQPDGAYSIIFQRRSTKKSVSPGVLDISASGHVVTGSNAKDTALQELREELGVAVSEDDLIHVGRRIDMYEAPGVLSRIFADVFVVALQELPKGFTYERSELDEIVLVPAKSLIVLFGEGGSTECVAYRITGEGQLTSESIIVKPNEFLPRIDNLYIRVARLANEFDSTSSHFI